MFRSSWSFSRDSRNVQNISAYWSLHELGPVRTSCDIRGRRHRKITSSKITDTRSFAGVFVSVMMYELFIIFTRSYLTSFQQKDKRLYLSSSSVHRTLIHMMIFVRRTIYDTMNNALLLTFYFLCCPYKYWETFPVIRKSSIIVSDSDNQLWKNSIISIFSKMDIRSTRTGREISMTRR